MKIRNLLWVALFVLLLAPWDQGYARGVKKWTREELLEKSDLVVLAEPIESRFLEVNRHDPMPHPGNFSTGLFSTGLTYTSTINDPYIQIETKLKVVSCIKGDCQQKEITVFHYAYNPLYQGGIYNGPSLITFDSKSSKPIGLFLIKQSDDTYVPTSGQIDPIFSVFEATPAIKTP